MFLIKRYCYKTSIDVTNDRLSIALFQQLVYTNITVMDQYLPGVQALLSSESSLVEASWAIESPETHFRPETPAAIQA